MADRSEVFQERANNLAAAKLNGLARVIVRLTPLGAPVEAELELVFFNDNGLADLALETREPKWMFPLSGGFRLLAGPGMGQVQVSAWQPGADSRSLLLTVAPIGDYSTYTLAAAFDWIDPVFAELTFKFRPSCFNTNCLPDWTPAPAPEQMPAIDYLARDFASFREVAFDAMRRRVPHWEPTSEADLDMVLINLFAAAGDELADFQDRVINEAWLTRARRRISLARHARLMDYHIHQGNQADTWIVLTPQPGQVYTQGVGLQLRTEADPARAGTVFFTTREAVRLHHKLGARLAYDWSGTVDRLVAGTTRVDLDFAADQAGALEIRDLIVGGGLRQLLIQEELDPSLGTVAGHHPDRRQVLTLDPDPAKTLVKSDPLTGSWFLRLHWHEPLTQTYVLIAAPPTGKISGVTRFYGNLVKAYHGAVSSAVYRASDQLLANQREGHYYRDGARGTVCPLLDRYIAYLDSAPGGQAYGHTTLAVTVSAPGELDVPWSEQPSLTRSREGDRNFLVETDEHGFSLLRFGNGANGRPLPPGAWIQVSGQVGRPLDGNVGAETLIFFDANQAPKLASARNPLPAVNGRAPETPEQIVRAVGEAWSQRQERAITLEDYRRAAEQVARVSRARAFYAWTGSTRCVRVAVDPAGAIRLDDPLRAAVAAKLEPLRLIGEDIEVRAPDYVPVEIHLRVCAEPQVSPLELRFLLEQAFSSERDLRGQPGFFHPDRWTFGQDLHASKLAALAQRIPGVRHVDRITMRRVFARAFSSRVIHAGEHEILLVKNDPDSMEQGYVFIEVIGGRS